MALREVQLVTCHRIALLLAMMANVQYELYQLVTEFIKGVLNPRVEFPYIYFMA